MADLLKHSIQLQQHSWKNLGTKKDNRDILVKKKKKTQCELQVLERLAQILFSFKHDLDYE